MARLSLCPNCKTIQVYGKICGICTCPVGDAVPVEKTTGEDFELEDRKQSAILSHEFYQEEM